MAAAYPLDRIDRRILKVLQAEGRITNHAMAERVALSPSACLARVRRLEEAGVIEGYHARLNPYAINVGMVLFAQIELKGHSASELSKFEAALQTIRAGLSILF